MAINLIKSKLKGRFLCRPFLLLLLFIPSLLNAENIDLLRFFPYAYTESPWFFINLIDESSHQYLGMGWGPTELSKIPSKWIVGQKANVKVVIRKTKDLFLFICLKGLPEFQEQKVEVWLNDFPIAFSQLTPSFKIYKFLLPKTYQIEGENSLSFKFNIFSKIISPKYLPEGIKKDIPLTAAARWLLLSEENSNFALIDSNYFSDFAIISSPQPAFVIKSKQMVSFTEKIPKKANLSFSFSPINKKTSPIKLKLEIKNLKNSESFFFFQKDINKKIKLPLSNFANEITSLSFQILPSKNKIIQEIKIIQPLIEIEKKITNLTKEQQEYLSKLKDKIKSKNLIILSFDGASASHLSLYGYYRHTTPFIDKLSEESIVFKKAFVNASYSIASIASLFSGLLPASHGILSSDFSLPDEANLLPEYFKENGFKTAAFRGNYFFSKAFGFQQGFDYFYEPPVEVLFKNSSILIKEAKKWILSNPNQKFFMFIHFREPHGPYKPPPEFSSLFWNKTLLPSKVQELQSIKCTDFAQRTPEEIEFIISQYDALIRYIDSLIQDFYSFLKENNFAENTILIVLSDHGQSFWQHEIHTHSLLLYDEIINIPLIFKFPSDLNIKNKKIDALIETIDILPTILDLYSFKSKNELPGQSFLTCILFNKCPDKYFILSQSDPSSSPLVSLRNSKYKFISNLNKKQFELYNLEKDPSEKNNIFNENFLIAKFFKEHLGKSLEEAIKYRFFIPQRSNISGEIREKLKALGYID